MRIHHDLEVYALPGQLLLQIRHISAADIQKFVSNVSEICSTFGEHLAARRIEG